MRSCLVADQTFAQAQGQSQPLPADLHPALGRALRARGIFELYSHQARAFETAALGRSLVVATPTASGKSLCFHLPVLDAIAKDKNARALYVYPTKALSRDQEASLGALMADTELGIGRIVYDGDTPGDARRAAREKSAVVMTNPDMLSAGILPHHPQWARLFQGLRFVVLDELHTYRGVFGSHMAHVLARLARQIELSADPVLTRLRRELCSYPAPSPGKPRDGGAEREFVVPLKLLSPSGLLSFFSTTTVFGTPVDITLAELAIESFFPADQATAAIMHRLSGARAPDERLSPDGS